MIPLAQWLAERATITRPSQTADVPAVGDREHAEALERLKASLAAEHDEKIEDLKRRHADDLEAARQAWCAQEATQLTDRLQSAIASLEHSISDQVAACLSPVLNGALKDRAMQAFADRLRSITGDDLMTGLKIEGPAALLETIKESLGARTDAVSFQEADTVEVSAWVNGTRVQSCLEPWAKALAEELA